MPSFLSILLLILFLALAVSFLLFWLSVKRFVPGGVPPRRVLLPWLLIFFLSLLCFVAGITARETVARIVLVPVQVLAIYFVVKESFPIARTPALQATALYCSLMAVLFVAVLLPLRHDFNAYRVPSTAMEPAWTAGDLFLVDRRPARAGELHRGDCVVFTTPGEHPMHFFKRIVAVEGDSLYVRKGRLYRGGARVDEPWIQLRDDGEGRGMPLMVGPLRVQPDHLFVLGDNRDRSHDSRLFGQVPVENVDGVACCVLWPPARMGSVPR